MEKVTKEVLTKEKCQSELLSVCKAGVSRYLIGLPCLLLLVLPLAIGCAYMAAWAVQFCQNNVLLLALGAVCILGFLALTVPIVVLIRRLYGAHSRLQKAKKGEFSVRQDTILRVASEREGRRPVRALYFDRYGRYVAGTSSEYYADPGETFYVVLCSVKDPQPILAYSAKLYIWKE